MEPLLTLKSEARAEIKILRSRFLTVIRPISTAEAFKAMLAEIAAEHKTANHHCYAYVLGKNGETIFCSDAGEPAGTAGKPMLNVLRRARLSNVGAVVTRYFGGIKLGVRGLIDAYGQAVEAALAEAEIEPLVFYVRWTVSCEYDLLETVKYRLRGAQGECGEFGYTDRAAFTVTTPEAMEALVEEVLRDFAVGGRLRYERCAD